MSEDNRLDGMDHDGADACNPAAEDDDADGVDDDPDGTDDDMCIAHETVHGNGGQKTGPFLDNNCCI